MFHFVDQISRREDSELLAFPLIEMDPEIVAVGAMALVLNV